MKDFVRIVEIRKVIEVQIYCDPNIFQGIRTIICLKMSFLDLDGSNQIVRIKFNDVE